LIAGGAYFLLLFALGFVLGTLRVILVQPRFGTLAATLAEVPVMLTAALYTCRWAIRRWSVPPEMSIRWAMVLWFVILLFVFETLLGTLLFGRTAADQWATLKTTAGMVGLGAQLIAAMFPVVVGKGMRP
jgi:hypothetical protein